MVFCIEKCKDVIDPDNTANKEDITLDAANTSTRQNFKGHIPLSSRMNIMLMNRTSSHKKTAITH